MTAPIRYPCGCVNAVDPPSGVLRSVAKCRRHEAARQAPGELGWAYYESLGVLADRDMPHPAELAEALGPFPGPAASRAALEVGCGASPYAGTITSAGWDYTGLDASPWAADWTARRWGVTTAAGDWGDWSPPGPCGLVLCAHALEHFDDAPAALAKMAGSLAPGGELWVVVPDDSDPVNPDHLWMFTEPTLRACVETAGLTVVRTAVRKYVAHENFIYLRARKPD